MELALGAATSLLGKVLTTLSDSLVAAYVDSLELGLNSEQIRAKLAHTRGVLHNAQGSDAGHNPGLQELLPALRKNADQAEDLLDEVHYFQIHDKLHGTNYATIQEAGPDLRSVVRHQALHVRSALRHTVGCLLQCFSCSHTQEGANDSASADGDTLHFNRVSVSRDIKTVLKDMQTQCVAISDLLGSIPSSSTAVVIHRPQIGSTSTQGTLYGRKDIFEETLIRIMRCDQTVSVLPIVGPGGIGKTTFTQHLYNDGRAEKHFQVRVWVCVSTDFDVLKLTREILGCIPATEGSSSVANETTNLDQLQISIASRIKSKRFIIVLDDIWKCGGELQWETLLAPFKKGETKGSMVLVTTRFPKLAYMMKTVDPLELAGLQSDDFFRFFEACIFGEHKPEHYDGELAGIAGKIAKKLKGSPLAAKTVGRLLRKDPSQEHWNGVLLNNEWLKQQNLEKDDIMPSLQISYDYLPFDLKKCFPYFGLFPEDRRFYNSEMNHLFVAIGIADSTHQVGRNYLEELVDNGFLMKEVDYWGQCCYVMHDLMHELSKSVSAQECLNISDLAFRADAIPQSVRHVSITIEDRYDADFEREMGKLRERIEIANLRTLMIFRSYSSRIAELLNDCFKKINSLRVLFIEVDFWQPFPDRFSKLIHLQYLKISSWNCRMSLPSTLSRFYHLKFLDLHGWHGSSDLPEDFSHLENLHDFCAEGELHSNIRNVGKIKHLQRLKEFRVKKESMGFELREIGALTELEELIICGLEHVATKEEATAAKLESKRNLKELTLLWDRDRPTTDACGLEHVATKEEATSAKLESKRNLKELTLLWDRDRPTTDADILDALQPHSNLRVLTIANHGGTIGPSWLSLDMGLTCLDTLILDGVSWSTLPPLGKLPNLKVLILKRISEMCQFRCGGAPSKCFMRLKSVVFHEMPELAEWVVEPNCGSFPSLEIIECIDCPNLHVMPFSEVSCTNLCKLKVSGCPKICLPSMPHTSTLTDLDVKETALGSLSYDGKELVVGWYGGALAFHNLDKVEDLSINGKSHISLTDIEKLKSLRKLAVLRCPWLFPEELDVSIAFHSVKSFSLDVSCLTRKSLSIALNCFPALSVLNIDGDPTYKDDDYEEYVMQFPSSSSLQELSFFRCERLVLVPVVNGGGIQEDNSSLQSLAIKRCGKLFSRWPMGEAGAQTIYPFPASLRELHVTEEPSMKSMALLSNLTSLTTLWLVHCSNLTVDGFNPLIAVNLRELSVINCNTVGVADLLSEVARTKLLPAGYISRLEKLFSCDNISGLLVAPICNLLAPALTSLQFYGDNRVESFTEEQEKALQLLTSLKKLEFGSCKGLQSLPQGLHRLFSLEKLHVSYCPKIRSMPKEGLPVSLRNLWIYPRSAEIDEQIEKIKRTNPDLSDRG